MWVELDIYGYMDDLERLRTLLLEHGYRDFTIKGDIICVDTWPTRRAAVYVGVYCPCDGASAKELTSKVAAFKREAERLNRENYRLRERVKALRAKVAGFSDDRKRPG